MATSMISATCSAAGRSTAAPTEADRRAASTYWPSTPMLNRFIRNPMATALPARYSGVARLAVATSVSSRVP